MKKRSLMMLTLVVLLGMHFTGCKKEKCEEHTWIEATCTHAAYCSTCGKTSGGVLNHTGSQADCEHAGRCTICNGTLGGPLGHKWTVATYQSPKTCTVCGKTDGEPLKEPDDFFARALEELVTKSLTCQAKLTVALSDSYSDYSEFINETIQVQRDGNYITLSTETTSNGNTNFLILKDNTIYVYQKYGTTYELMEEYPLEGMPEYDISSLPFEEISNMFTRVNGIRTGNTEYFSTLINALLQEQGIPFQAYITTFDIYVKRGHIEKIVFNAYIDLNPTQILIDFEVSFSNIGSTIVTKPAEIVE